MHMSVLTYSGLHHVLVIVYASNVVIHILRGKDIIARALHGHLLVCFEDFCDEKRKYKITELLFKENINEQLSIPDSTATDDIVYIFS